MDHGRREDGREACHLERSTPMDIQDQKTRRSCESTIGRPPQTLGLPFFLVTMILRLRTILGTRDWSRLCEARSCTRRVSPITPPDIGPTGDLVLLTGSDTAPREEPYTSFKVKSLTARCWAEDEEFLAERKIGEWPGGR